MSNNYDPFQNVNQDMTDDEMNKAMADMYESLGLNEEPDDDTLDDMMMQQFYDELSSVDVNKDSLKLLYNQLTQLQSYQKNGYIRKYPPASAFVNKDNVKLGDPVISGDERLHQIYHIMAIRLDNMGYANKVRNRSVEQIQSNLEKGAIQNYINTVQENLDKQFVKDAVDNVFAESNGVDNLPFDKILQYRIDHKERFTNRDKSLIQSKILETAEKLSLSKMSCESNYEADKASLQLDESYITGEGFLIDDTNLPAYITEKIGSVDSISDRRKQLESDYEDNMNAINKEFDNFYASVYDLSGFDLKDPNPDVFGWNEVKPIIISNDTIKALGSDYEVYAENRMQSDLKSMRGRVIGKSLNAFGIDITKDVKMDVLKEQEKQTEVQQVSTYINQYNEEDDWSYDEKDEPEVEHESELVPKEVPGSLQSVLDADKSLNNQIPNKYSSFGES